MDYGRTHRPVEGNPGNRCRVCQFPPYSTGFHVADCQQPGTLCPGWISSAHFGKNVEALLPLRIFARAEIGYAAAADLESGRIGGRSALLHYELRGVQV